MRYLKRVCYFVSTPVFICDFLQIIGKINSEESKKREIETLKNKISALQKCPTCLQEVSKEYKINIFNKIDQENQEIQRNLNELSLNKNKLIEQIEIVKKAKEDFKKRKSELELLKIKLENIKEKQHRILDIEKERQTIQKDLDMLEKHIKTLETSIIEFSKYDIIYTQRDKELQEAKINENKTAIKQAEINKEVQFLEQQIKEKQEKITKK